jgi:hypothetical protein
MRLMRQDRTRCSERIRLPSVTPIIRHSLLTLPSPSAAAPMCGMYYYANSAKDSGFSCFGGSKLVVITESHVAERPHLRLRAVSLGRPTPLVNATSVATWPLTPWSSNAVVGLRT